MALKVGELFASFNLDTSGLNGAISSAEQSLSSIGKGLTIGGAAMTAAITAPIVNAAKEIYAAGAGFNAQMSRVFAIRGLDSSVAEDVDAMNALRQEALRMAAATKFSTEEAGQAFEYMAMAGWDVDNMLAGLEPVMNLAIASGNDLARVSDIVTDAMTAFGLSAEGTTKILQDGQWVDVNNVQHFSDVLAAVSTNANTNVDLMGETFKYVASLAGAMGYSIEDVGLAIGLMANSGVKGSQAGTSLKNILTRLAAPTDEVAGAMEQLGISLDDGKGNMKPLRQVMQDLRKGFGGLQISQEEFTSSMADLDSQLASGKMTQKQYDNAVEDLTKKAFGAEGALKAEAAAAIAGKYGLAGLLAIVSATDEDFEKLMESIDNCNGATEKMGKTMSDNAAGDVMRLKSAINVLYTDLWMLGENGFRKVVQDITGMINGFQQLNPEIKLGAMRILALAAATGPAMIGMGTMLLALPKIAAAIAGLVSPVGLLAIGFVALGAAAIDEGNSIGKTIEAMAQKAGTEFPKIGKAARAEIPKLESNMSAFLASVRSGIETAIPGMVEGVGDLLITAATVLKSKMPEIAQTATTFIRTLASSIRQKAPEVLAAVGRLALNMIAEIIRAQPDMLAAGLDLFGAIVDSVSQINWTEVGTTIHNAIKDALKGIRENFYTFLFGEEPTAESLGDWGSIGKKIASLISSGFSSALNGGKDLLGSLVLGEDYQPDDSWGTVAAKIWNKITSSMASVLTASADLIKGLVLGDDYTADASWGDVAIAIWNKIKSAFAILATNAKDLIGTLALGEGYTAHSSWREIGLAIWNKAKEKFADLAGNAKDLIGTLMLGGEYTADESWEKIGSAIWEKVLAGVAAGKAVLDAILEKIGSITIDAETITTTVNNAGNFVSGLAGKLLDGKIEWGTKISGFIGKIVDEITAFNGWDSFGTSLGQSAANLVSALVGAIPKAVDAAGNAINVGAKLASGIMTSLSSALATIDESGLAETVGTVSADLVHGILTGITEFGNNPDVQTFMVNLGNGISSGMHFLGNIAGDIVAYIISPQGLMDIYNAGLALGKILLTGLTSVVGGLGSFLNGLVESALVSWGVLDGDELKAAKEAGETLATTTAQAFEQAAASGSTLDAGTELLANMANILSGNVTGMDSAAFDLARDFRDTLKDAVNYANDPESFRTEVTESMQDLFGESIKLPFIENLDFWGKLYEAVASGKDSEVMSLVNEILASSLTGGGKVEEAAAEAASVYPEAVQAVIDQLGITAEEAASQNGGIEQTMKGASQQGMQGYEAGILEGQTGAADAAAQVSDAAVQVFLLTMSEANGTTIGTGFVTGITNGVTNQSDALTQAAQLAGNRVVAAAYSTANSGTGWTIGHNFGQGFVNGIRSMISAAASAASSLGSAAGNALSSATQEGSPSEWTTKIGHNFGTGFFNGILSMAGDIASAAASLGQGAGDALSMTARDMGQSTVGSMEAPAWAGGTATAGGNYIPQKQEPALERFTGMIVSALEHVAVQMDSETVGHLVVDTVSEDIAHRASTRRAAIA